MAIESKIITIDRILNENTIHITISAQNECGFETMELDKCLNNREVVKVISEKYDTNQYAINERCEDNISRPIDEYAFDMRQKEQITRFLKSHNYESSKVFENLKFTDLDTEQLAIKISEDIWLYSEYDENNILLAEPYRTEFMYFDDFSTTEFQEDAISGYYGSIDEVKEIYGNDWKQILLECAFEQEM